MLIVNLWFNTTSYKHKWSPIFRDNYNERGIIVENDNDKGEKNEKIEMNPQNFGFVYHNKIITSPTSGFQLEPPLLSYASALPIEIKRWLI